MSGFYDDEQSPWASQVDDGLTSAFDAPHDEVSPWGNPSEPSSPIEDTPLGQSTNYDPYSYDSVPLVANTADEDGFTSANPESEAYSRTAAPESPENAAIAALSSNEPVPELKPTKRKPVKKNRASNLKAESVDSDPLAASVVQFTDVSLSKPSSSSHSSSSPASSSHNGPNLTNSALAPDTASGSISLRSASELAPSLSPSSGFGSAIDSASKPIHRVQKIDSHFEISVSDPATVGDLANAHTEYTVQLTTDCDAYEIKETAVQRRYSDFRWLYRTLEHTHPGVVVPPVPEKQALGRFDDGFVQQRRAGLETMLRKIVAHPLLYKDVDLIAFLTSDDFGEYVRTRLVDDETLQKVTHSTSSGDYHDNSSTGGSGFIGTLSGALSLSRGNEADPWTVQKRKRLDEVEQHLRTISRDLVTVSIHRQQLGDTLGDLSSVLQVLSEIEATQRLSSVLRSFSKVHDRLSAICARQRQQNLLTLEATLEEHTRTIGSIRDAINARQRIFSEAESLGSEYEKRQAALGKFRRQGRVQDDRDKALEEDAEEAGQRAEQLQRKARDVALLVENEIARVNEEKIAEFRNAVEVYLETTIEAQKEAIEVWETFYSRNFAS